MQLVKIGWYYTGVGKGGFFINIAVFLLRGKGTDMQGGMLLSRGEIKAQ